MPPRAKKLQSRHVTEAPGLTLSGTEMLANCKSSEPRTSTRFGETFAPVKIIRSFDTPTAVSHPRSSIFPLAVNWTRTPGSAQTVCPAGITTGAGNSARIVRLSPSYITCLRGGNMIAEQHARCDVNKSEKILFARFVSHFLIFSLKLSSWKSLSQ